MRGAQIVSTIKGLHAAAWATMRFFYIVILASATLAETIPAFALDIPENDKCLPSTNEKSYGEFMPQDGREILAVQQRQWAPPLKPNDVYCKMTISIFKYDPISRSPVQVWGWDMRGPGQIFTDGYWHEQPTKISARIDGVHLLPLSVDPYDQLLIYHFERTAYGSQSFLRIVAFTTPFGNDALLLDFSSQGELTYNIENTTISVRSEIGDVKVKFDPEIGAFAITEPTASSVRVFHYLTTEKFDETGYN